MTFIDQRSNSYDASTTSELFHENSKQQRSDYRLVDRIIAITNNPILLKASQSHKYYPSALKTALPEDLPKTKTNFGKVILNRRSNRNFTGAAINLIQAANILFFANGVTSSAKTADEGQQLFRAAPSGGALYPIEVYFIASRVKGLEHGIYHYDPIDNVLECIKKGDYRSELITATFTEELSKSAAIIALTGIFLKNQVKYAERGYRFTLMEAGHIAQNILLTATSLNIGSFPIGGFIDDEIDNLLNIDGIDEVSLYLIALGQI